MSAPRSRQQVDGDRSPRGVPAPPPRSPSLRRAAHQLLNRDECAAFKAALRAFRETTTAEQLVDSLSTVIDSPRKLDLLRDIALLLPASQRVEFVRLAKRRFPGSERLLPSNGEADIDGDDDLGDWPPPTAADDKITLAESGPVRRLKGEVERPRVIKLSSATFQVRYRSRLSSASSASQSATSASAGSVLASNSSQESQQQHQQQQLHLGSQNASRARAASVSGFYSRRDSTVGGFGFIGGPRDKGFWALNSPRRGLQELRRQERLQSIGAAPKAPNGGSTHSLATGAAKPGVSFMLTDNAGRYWVPAPGRSSTPSSPLVRSTAAGGRLQQQQQQARPRAFSVLTADAAPGKPTTGIRKREAEEKAMMEFVDVSSGSNHRREPDSAGRSRWQVAPSDFEADEQHFKAEEEAESHRMKSFTMAEDEAAQERHQNDRKGHKPATEETHPIESKGHKSSAEETPLARSKGHKPATEETHPAGSKRHKPATEETHPAGSKGHKAAPEETHPAGSKGHKSAVKETHPTGSKGHKLAKEETHPTESKGHKAAPEETHPAGSKGHKAAPEETHPTWSKGHKEAAEETHPAGSRRHKAATEGTHPAGSKGHKPAAEETHPIGIKGHKAATEETHPAGSKGHKSAAEETPLARSKGHKPGTEETHPAWSKGHKEAAEETHPIGGKGHKSTTEETHQAGSKGHIPATEETHPTGSKGHKAAAEETHPTGSRGHKAAPNETHQNSKAGQMSAERVKQTKSPQKAAELHEEARRSLLQNAAQVKVQNVLLNKPNGPIDQKMLGYLCNPSSLPTQTEGGTPAASAGGSRRRWTQTEPPAQLETSACQTEEVRTMDQHCDFGQQAAAVSSDCGGCDSEFEGQRGPGSQKDSSIHGRLQPAETQTSPDAEPAAAGWIPPWRCRHQSAEPGASAPDPCRAPSCGRHSPPGAPSVPQSASMPADLVLQWLAGHMMAQAAAAAAAAATAAAQENLQQKRQENWRRVTLKRDSDCRRFSNHQQHQHLFGISVVRGWPTALTEAAPPSSTVLVTSVASGSPAHHLGIQPGDEILEVDGAPADTMTLQQLAEAISQQDTVSLIVRPRSQAETANR